MADSQRLFIALELPDAMLAALREVQGDLEREAGDQLRFVRPEGVHLTLKFLGEVDSEGLGAIEAALTDAVRPFELQLRPARLSGFGGRRIRVVWVGVEGDIDALVELAQDVDRAMETEGFEPEGRPLAPHLTLARVRDRASADERSRIADYVTRYRMADLPAFSVSAVSLIRSRLGPGGARYETISRFPDQTS